MPMSSTTSRIVSSSSSSSSAATTAGLSIIGRANSIRGFAVSKNGMRNYGTTSECYYHGLSPQIQNPIRTGLSSTTKQSMMTISGFHNPRRFFSAASYSGSLLRNPRNLGSALMFPSRNSKSGCTCGLFDTTYTRMPHQQSQNRSSVIGGGGYSRMLDMGGAPSALNDNPGSSGSTHKLNLGKNCHLQAVIFDFDVLTRSVQQAGSDNNQPGNSTSTTAPNLSGIVPKHAIEPDRGKIEQLAGLLNVDLGGCGSNKIEKSMADQSFKDDLSLLLTGEKSSKPAATTTTTTSSNTDIRAKYAAKLQSAGFQSGLSAVDRAKEEQSTSTGDAAGHWAARAHATTIPASTNRWMAATGTGKLLQYLHQRSMKLVLVGTPVSAVTDNNTPHSEETQQMNDFLQQLKDKVVFTAVIPQDGTLTVDRLAQRAIQEVLMQKPSSSNGTTTSPTTPAAATSASSDTLSPDRCLWVSDRDDCLRAAREAGLVTVRIRPPNARRGQVSAHYTVETVPETQQVINEINGISFKTVLQQGV